MLSILAYLFLRARQCLLYCAFFFVPAFCAAQQTTVKGKVVDAETGQPLQLISITFGNGHMGTSTDSLGRFSLTAPGSFSRVNISGTGYQSLTKAIKARAVNDLQIRLAKSNAQLKEVEVSGGKGKPYRNKDNPAVELIRRVISRKDSNRIQSEPYLQYSQYERINLSVTDMPLVLVNSFLFRPFKFMLDTVDGKSSLPVYISERRYMNYSRREPEKTIKVLTAQKERNIIQFLDTAGVNIFLNRLYGNTIDIYENNIFIFTNQFLSPIANHAPDFYKFFITDTVTIGKEAFVELSFVPRTKGDLLFEGHLLVTLDGRYTVSNCELQVNKQINLNFIRNFDIGLDFQKQANGRYFLVKSDVKADFGILQGKKFGATGERVIYNSNYVANAPLSADFYHGKSEQSEPGFNKPDTAYWLQARPDTLPQQQVLFYKHMARLENMKQYKTESWIAYTLGGGYADLGAFQFNVGNLVSYDYVEGLRLGVGGRTTPKFNKNIYLQGYVADGLDDHKVKYSINTFYSFNQLPFYKFPNDYLEVTQQYDVNLPGEQFATGNFQTPISSFQTGTSHYYLYSNVFKVDYVKEYDSHFSFDVSFKNLTQQATGSLAFDVNNVPPTVVDNLTTSEIGIALRYAPHEQLYQGTDFRLVIPGKYPTINFGAAHGLKGVLNGSYNYNNFTTTIMERFYLSQLGFADVTVLGGLLTGKVPFPLLDISAANQSILYDPDAYNKMNYLEFVSDHYVGLNVTQSFNGFILNKLPLIKHLKWREYLSFKVLYGGLRDENNPLLSKGLYNFPTAAGGTTGTYALGSTPYVEAGAGIGNIFKLLRVDVIRRFNYLDHPGVSPYGIKFTLGIDL